MRGRPDSAHDIAAKCRAGDLKPLEVIRTALKRIKAADEAVHAFLHIDEEQALGRAESLTREGPPVEGSGLLMGVPVAIKDNINVRGLPMTCGSRLLEGYRSVFHASAVEAILREGGVIVGKTNMDEFAMGSSTEFSAYGITRNPWHLMRIPGGSSGGSAAAVASGGVPAALGSDTGGSIRQPAALCGCVGFKPTYGAVSRFGLTAFASSLDQVGPLAGDVRDAALLFEVIAGHDARDSTSIPKWRPEVLRDLDSGIDGWVIGVPDEYLTKEMDGEVRQGIEDSLDLLTRCGARIERISLPMTRFAVAAYYLLANAEASSNLARFDGIRYGQRRGKNGLEDSYRTTRKAGFGPEVKRRIALGTFSLSAGYYDAFYSKAQKIRRLIQEEFKAAFQKVDLIVGPTSPLVAFEVGEKLQDPLKMYLCDILTAPASLAGIPGLSIPCPGTRKGLPVGLQILGPPKADSKVLRAGRTLERQSKQGPISPVAHQVLKIR